MREETIQEMLDENTEWTQFYEEKLTVLRDRRAIIENIVKLNKLNQIKLK